MSKRRQVDQATQRWRRQLAAWRRAEGDIKAAANESGGCLPEGRRRDVHHSASGGHINGGGVSGEKPSYVW